ncbi:hypothetical protein AB9K26_04955 [Psychroserpens sp. XS_ASV72]|uniref:hypothetical protein n=1 Tax=Psychroserpens sp. XS_ASV72 TaxID=3241293 RepID=UPI0035122DD5
MKTEYLLSNKFKIPGWILLILGLVLGVYESYAEFESDIFVTKVLAVFSSGLGFLGSSSEENNTFFRIIENSIIDEIAALAIIFGGLLVGFSREKVEDEFIYKLRKDSLVWAIIFNYVILALTVVFVYEFSFFNVLVYNMFTPLLFFIIRFNFLKARA